MYKRQPTNHLDIASREWIEEAVEAFDGTLLFVSHDRYFINRFATRVWELAEGTINDYPMGFAQYRAAKAEEKKPAPAPVQKKKQDTRPPRAGREKQAARRQLTDVYKRQSMSSIMWAAVVGLGRPEVLPLGAAMGTPAARMMARVTGWSGQRTPTVSRPPVVCRGTMSRRGRIMAVSYTHLDVYKRQMITPAR